MNEILQKRIEEAAKEFDKESSRIIFENGANFILNNIWVSVDEALPPKDDLYFVLINGLHPRVTEFENGKLQGYDNITHWMEIPKNE